MLTTFAITRQVSPAMQDCELTHLERQTIDIALANQQHRRYEQTLAELGCVVQSLPAEPHLPDSVFVEDPAIVLDELAILTRPGAASRRPEVESLARALAPYRQLVTIQAPGTLDGGDVLRVGRRIFIGQSSRSSLEAIEQVRAAVEPLGYQVEAVPVRGCLHLKSAVTQVGEHLLLLNPEWVDPQAFPGLETMAVDPGEPSAGNGLLVGETLIYPSAFPATRRELEKRGISLRLVDVSELAKAEGAVTCCSLIFSV